MVVRRKFRRGLSELIIVLALIAIVIPIVMALQGWLSSKAANLEALSVVQPLSGYVVSRDFVSNTEIITISLRNQGRTPYNITNFRAVLSDGSIGDAVETRGDFNRILEPGTERVYIIKVSVNTPMRVRSLIVTAVDTASNKPVEISINL